MALISREASACTSRGGAACGLEAGKIGAWIWNLDGSEEILEAMFQSLSTDERSRARSFKFEADRKRFIAARGGMRKLLGCLLGKDPGKLSFAYSPWGKPYLEGEACTLGFNLSHSGDTALFVAAQGLELGVDLEFEREDLDPMEIGSLALSPREYEWLFERPVSERQAAFLEIWTLKEAVLKARGLGIGSKLQDFTVLLEAPAPRVFGDASMGDPEAWRCFSFSPGTKMQAAIACYGTGLAKLELAPLTRLSSFAFSENRFEVACFLRSQ
jgi:4'-phosphopantetheinyl transferase